MATATLEDPAATEGHFCVIGTHIGQHCVPRGFRKAQAEAAQHGAELLVKGYRKNGQANRLYVVEVVEVLEIGDETPPVRSRKPNLSDLP